jgi:hypothetical protein
METPYHRTDRQIFNEKPKMHRNTVNGSFAAVAVAPGKNCGKSVDCGRQAIELLAEPQGCGADAAAEHSTLPKARR